MNLRAVVKEIPTTRTDYIKAGLKRLEVHFYVDQDSLNALFMSSAEWIEFKKHLVDVAIEDHTT